jgi:hypothetical protein
MRDRARFANDNTPWDNTEFATQTTDTFFRATPGSTAYGRYDLLTTILHVRASVCVSKYSATSRA